MEDISNDIKNFMDSHKITMATIGGHGFGAKVATATAINHMDRFTGVINLDGGPLDHRYYEAYQELVSYVEICKKMNLASHDYQSATRFLFENIACPKWRSILKQNINTEKSPL